MSHILLALRVFSSQLVRFRLLFVAFGSILLFSGMAHASIIAVLTSGPTPIGGGRFQYTYRFDVTNDERVDPAATNGATCPSPTLVNIQCNPPGTFLTIYDIPGFVAAGTTAPNFTLSQSFTGVTPSTINGPSIDDPNLINVTFTYNGPVVAGPASFSDFTIVSTFGTLNPFGNFSSQSTKNAGPSSGQTDQLTSSVPIPMRPTAAAVMVGGRVMTESGRGIRGVVVTMIDQIGNIRQATTGSFGYYQFPDTEVGQTYTFSIRAKSYTFRQQSQILSLSDETNEINFYGTAAFR